MNSPVAFIFTVFAALGTTFAVPVQEVGTQAPAIVEKVAIQETKEWVKIPVTSTEVPPTSEAAQVVDPTLAMPVFATTAMNGLSSKFKDKSTIEDGSTPPKTSTVVLVSDNPGEVAEVTKTVENDEDDDDEEESFARVESDAKEVSSVESWTKQELKKIESPTSSPPRNRIWGNIWKARPSSSTTTTSTSTTSTRTSTSTPPSVVNHNFSPSNKENMKNALDRFYSSYNSKKLNHSKSGAMKPSKPVRYTPVFANVKTFHTTTTSTTPAPIPTVPTITNPFISDFKFAALSKGGKVEQTPQMNVKVVSKGESGYDDSVTQFVFSDPNTDTEKSPDHDIILKLLKKLTKQQSVIKNMIHRLTSRQRDILFSIGRIEDKFEYDDSKESFSSSSEEKKTNTMAYSSQVIPY